MLRHICSLSKIGNHSDFLNVPRKEHKPLKGVSHENDYYSIDSFSSHRYYSQ